jgi:hypothetical protein
MIVDDESARQFQRDSLGTRFKEIPAFAAMGQAVGLSSNLRRMGHVQKSAGRFEERAVSSFLFDIRLPQAPN